jgi:uncharacterized membrane protein
VFYWPHSHQPEFSIRAREVCSKGDSNFKIVTIKKVAHWQEHLPGFEIRLIPEAGIAFAVINFGGLKSTVSNITLNRSTKFRAALKSEIPIWLEKEILTQSGAEQLREHYELEKLASESASLLASVIFTLGGLLLGGGVISFVAANWDDIPKSGKVTLLLVTLLAFHMTGYWLKNNRRWPRLGHALIFIGCLIFGANIGLFAQIFHISGEWYGAFGVWALGSVAVAWAVRSWLIGSLTLLTSFIWFTGFLSAHEQRSWLYPFAIAAALLPLAWMIRSRFLYTMTSLGIIITLCTVAGVEGDSGRYIVLAMTASGLLCWTLGETHTLSGIRQEFGYPTTGLGIAALSIAAYRWSFHDAWERPYYPAESRYFWIIPVAAAAITGFVLMARLWSRESSENENRAKILSVMSVVVLLCCGVLLNHFNNSSIIFPTIGANIAALLLAFLAVRDGIQTERRTHFWLGSLFGMLIIVSRFFEYESSLLLKSAAFIACGTAVILAGVIYERSMRRSEVMQ